MVKYVRLVKIMAIVIGWLACATSAQAGFNLITTRTGADTVFWGQLGGWPAPVPSPSAFTSIGGVIGVVSHDGIVERRNQGSGWGGNFAENDELLFQTGFTSSIDISTVPAMFVGGADSGRQVR